MSVILLLHSSLADLPHAVRSRNMHAVCKNWGCCTHLCFVYELLHCWVVVGHSQAWCAIDLQQPWVVV